MGRGNVMNVQYRGTAALVITLLYTIQVTGCAQTGQTGATDKQTAGTAMAMKFCRNAAKWIPRDIRTWGREIGVSSLDASFGCGYLGGQIGLQLDEMDREKMNGAAQAALNTGKVQTWNSPDTDTSGTAKIVKTTPAAKGGGNCRTVRNTITLDDGSQQQEDVTACKNANGEWEMVEG